MLNTLGDFLTKQFKTDGQYLIRGGFWLTLAKILSALAALATSVAFANILTEQQYGMFRYVLSVAALLAIPTLHGIETAIARSLAKDEAVNFTQVLTTRIKFGCIGAIASLGLASYYFFAENTTLGIIFLSIAFFIPITDSVHTYAGILLGQKKFNTLARDEVVTRAGASMALIAMLFYTQNIIVIVLTFFVITTLFRFMFLRLSLRNVDSQPVDSSPLIKYGSHLSMIQSMAKFATQIDKILLFQTVGAASLASYYLALIPYKQLRSLASTLPTLAFPKFSSNTVAGLQKTLPRKILLLYVLIIPIVVGYYFAAPSLFSLLYPQYTNAVLFTQILMCQLLFFPLSIIQSALTSQSKQKALYIITTSTTVLRVILFVILIPVYQIWGAIISSFAASTLSAVLTLILFFRKH